MTVRLIPILSAAVALFAVSPAGAGERIPVTLAEALEIATRSNPALAAASARVDAQFLRTQAVRRAVLPRLTLVTGFSWSNLPAEVFAGKLNAGEFTPQDFAIDRLNAPSALDHLGTVLTVEAPLDVFRKVRTQADGQSAAGDVASAVTREAAATVRLQVVESYRGADLAARALDVTQRALDAARAREQELAARVESGTALEADLLRARTRRRQREADLATRRADLEIALAGLSNLLGAPAGTSYVPTEGPAPVAPLADGEDTYLSRALANRAALVSAKRRVDAAALQTAGQTLAARPDLGVFGRVHDDRNGIGGGAQAWAVGVGLTWSAYDPARARRLAAARAEERAAGEDARAATDGVRLEVATAYRKALAARDRYAAAQGGAEDGREALRVVKERRAAGMATLTDELETETAALSAALEEIAAAADVARADAALRRAAGEI